MPTKIGVTHRRGDDAKFSARPPNRSCILWAFLNIRGKWSNLLIMEILEMIIRDYYLSQFRLDLAVFMPDGRVSYFGHSWHIDCRGLENVIYKNRAYFLICLYFTVLVDQAMHAHFWKHYQRFEFLTQYPKFCHGLGQFQKNPRDILLSPIEKGLVRKEEIDGLLEKGMYLFVDEVVDFCKIYMPEIDVQDFFDKLIYDPDVQIPLIVVLSDPDLKRDTGYLVYEALKKAVEEKMK